MKTKPSAKLIELVKKIQQEVEISMPRFAENSVPELTTHPIPFFGKLEEAEILTVGLNPSPGEFKNERWPREPIAAEHLTQRLHDYFVSNICASHSWFEKWSRACSELGESFQYQTGRVAHIDLSPRATKVVSRVQSIEVFNEMIRHDLRWLPDLLECAKSAQLLLIAGAVNKRKYLIEFLAANGHEHDLQVIRRDLSGRRPLGFYGLRFHSRCLPVFFSGSGPSARDRGEKLAKNISDHRQWILAHLKRAPLLGKSIETRIIGRHQGQSSL